MRRSAGRLEKKEKNSQSDRARNKDSGNEEIDQKTAQKAGRERLHQSK